MNIGKCVVGLATALGMAVACGESEKRPAPTPTVAGDGVGGDAAGDSLGSFAGAGARAAEDDSSRGGASTGEGGSLTGDAGSVTGDGGSLTGDAGSAARDPVGGAAGAADVAEPMAGAGGAEQDSRCVLEPPIQGDVPLATTSLTYFAGYDVELGQGADRDVFGGLANVQFLARGCVTGEETNLAQLGLGGAAILGGGTQTIGSVSQYRGAIGIGGVPPETLQAFNLAAQDAQARSLTGYRYSEAQLWGYSFKAKQRSTVENCGDNFIDQARPSQALAVVFKITLPTSDERDTFRACYLGGNSDLTLVDDAEPAERYLVAHHAEISIAVLQSAGTSQEDVQRVLAETGCSARALESCGITLNTLQKRIDAIGQTLPEASLTLHDLNPGWGVSSFWTRRYSELP